MTRKAPVGAAAFVALFMAGATGALASCNLLVGSGDYAVGGGGDSAEGAPDVTTENVVAQGADGGVDAGGRREAGSGVDAATLDAAAPACGQSLPKGQSDFAQLVSSCVLAISCDPFFFQVNLSTCITDDYLRSTTALSCLSTIQDCKGFYACNHVMNATIADCPTAGAGCDATNRAINCTRQARGYVADCAQLGGTCVTRSDGDGGSIADCVVVPSCTDTDGMSHCSGNKLYTCVNGAGFGEDCRSLNATCGTFSGSTDCYLDAPACTVAVDTCTAGSIAWCTSGGQQFVDHCSRAGLACSIDDAGSGSCVAPNCPSPPVGCTESCAADGKTLGVCVGGAPFTIDCTQFGFTSCTTATESSSGTVYGYCQ